MSYQPQLFGALGGPHRQGTKAPWKLHQNYALDLMNLRYSSVDDGAMVFSNPVPAPARQPVAA